MKRRLRKTKRRFVAAKRRSIFAISKNIDLQYSICVFEALIWLKCLTEKQQKFVNQKTFSIFVVVKQSEKVSSIKQKKEEAQGEKERIIVLTWAD